LPTTARLKTTARLEKTAGSAILATQVSDSPDRRIPV
jgi:hypothetical protein